MRESFKKTNKHFHLLLQGDSGSPLIVNAKLVGLVSWSYGCSLIDYPTVHTRVSSYIDWIEKNAVNTIDIHTDLQSAIAEKYQTH